MSKEGNEKPEDPVQANPVADRAEESDEEGIPTPLLPPEDPEGKPPPPAIEDQIAMNIRRIGDVQVLLPDGQANTLPDVEIIPETILAITPYLEEADKSDSAPSDSTSTDSVPPDSMSPDSVPPDSLPPISAPAHSCRPLTTDRPPGKGDLRDVMEYIGKLEKKKTEE